MIFLFVLQEVLQFGVGLYALQLVSDNLPDLGTDTVVVILDHLLHAVVAAGICKVRDNCMPYHGFFILLPYNDKIMKAIKFLITCIFLFFGISVFASTDNTLIIKAHHPNDNKTIVRIWKTPENNYIIRTSYSDKKDDFDQEKLSQYQKKVEYDGFAKRVILKTSDNAYYVIAYANEKFAFIYGFYSEALNNIVSVEYTIDFINKSAFNNL